MAYCLIFRLCLSVCDAVNLRHRKRVQHSSTPPHPSQRMIHWRSFVDCRNKPGLKSSQQVMKGTFNRWKSSWSQGTSDTNGTSQGNYTDETEGNSTRNTVSSNYDDQSLPPVRLNGYLPSTKKRLLTPEMCDEIRTLMPTRIQLYTDWHLLYSLEQHGSSLQSLYHNVAPKNNSPLRVGYVLVIRDNKHGIFGAYCLLSLKRTLPSMVNYF